MFITILHIDFLGTFNSVNHVFAGTCHHHRKVIRAEEGLVFKLCYFVQLFFIVAVITNVVVVRWHVMIIFGPQNPPGNVHHVLEGKLGSLLGATFLVLTGAERLGDSTRHDGNPLWR